MKEKENLRRNLEPCCEFAGWEGTVQTGERKFEIEGET